MSVCVLYVWLYYVYESLTSPNPTYTHIYAPPQEKQARRADTMNRAGAVDRKWRDELAESEKKELSSHVHTANLNYMLDYTRENPAPKTREHPLSWGHAHYLPDGTPVSPVGALERFGTYTIEPNEQKKQLHEWKQRAMESNEAFEERIQSFKEKQRQGK